MVPSHGQVTVDNKKKLKAAHREASQWWLGKPTAAQLCMFCQICMIFKLRSTIIWEFKFAYWSPISSIYLTLHNLQIGGPFRKTLKWCKSTGPNIRTTESHMPLVLIVAMALRWCGHCVSACGWLMDDVTLLLRDKPAFNLGAALRDASTVPVWRPYQALTTSNCLEPYTSPGWPPAETWLPSWNML